MKVNMKNSSLDAMVRSLDSTQMSPFGQPATQAPDNSCQTALGKPFPDINAAKAKYHSGQIVHASSEGVGEGGPRDSSFYGETWIPEQYARTGMGTGLQFVAGYFDGNKYDQACFALQKRK